VERSSAQSGDNIFLGDCERVEHEESGELIWNSDGIHTLLGSPSIIHIWNTFYTLNTACHIPHKT
jgi:hypothetical protein